MRIFKGDTRGTPCRTLHHRRGCVSAPLVKLRDLLRYIVSHLFLRLKIWYHIKNQKGDSTMASIDERLEKLKKQKEELKMKEKKLLAQKASEERKKRTKRLIEIGAAVESVLKQPIEKEDLPKLINFLEQQEERGNYFSKAMK